MLRDDVTQLDISPTQRSFARDNYDLTAPILYGQILINATEFIQYAHTS
jgi:hypothetical protein